VIVPSLFAPLVISAFLLSTGLYSVLFKPLYLLFRFLRLPLSEEQFGVFALSVTGGYPVGVNLVKRQGLDSAMLAYCYCGSPPFITAVAGAALYGGVSAGVIAYAANVLACITLAYLRGRDTAPPRRAAITQAVPQVSYGEHFINAVKSAKALGTVCFTVVAFNVLCELISFAGVKSPLPAAVLEISNLRGLTDLPLPLTAAITSFGGVCVLFQAVTLAEGLPLKKFLLYRVPAAALSAAYAYAACAYLRVHAGYVPAAAYVHAPTSAPGRWKILASGALFIMTAINLRYMNSRDTATISKAAPAVLPR